MEALLGVKKVQSMQDLKDEMLSVARGERKATDDAAQDSFEPVDISTYEADDGSFADRDINRIKKVADPMLPKGRVINTQTLL